MASEDHKDVSPDKPAAGSSPSDPAPPAVTSETAGSPAQASTPGDVAGTNTVEAEVSRIALEVGRQ